ncbi:hypothetical protein COO91_08236 [Nostoc flagelliforme CCNUN1]|uniref:Uncharacterized protein n=1 Tax=Nostoc flagelliforme CCNUN1 TaxID=2038116 RepID=A0A2K8T397_9NOSO|nr:hypothetical protein COO91_08236 [Nostoc flagelliforme CCNUN1]
MCANGLRHNYIPDSCFGLGFHKGRSLSCPDHAIAFCLSVTLLYDIVYFLSTVYTNL